VRSVQQSNVRLWPKADTNLSANPNAHAFNRLPAMHEHAQGVNFRDRVQRLTNARKKNRPKNAVYAASPTDVPPRQRGSEYRVSTAGLWKVPRFHSAAGPLYGNSVRQTCADDHGLYRSYEAHFNARRASNTATVPFTRDENAPPQMDCDGENDKRPRPGILASGALMLECTVAIHRLPCGLPLCE